MNSLERSFRIGDVLIDPPLALAPMAEVTDTYYRSLVKELGGAGLVVSEFISAEGLTRDNARTKQMLAYSESERPVAIQIYGGDPDRMDDAAAIVEAQGVDIVDINMGCPVKKIVNSGAGSALLKDFDRASRVVDKIKRRVKIPVTVKVRKGWESDDVLPLLKSLKGFKAAIFSANAESGKIWVSSIWETAEDREASDAKLTELRRKTATTAGAGDVKVEKFESAHVEFKVGATSATR
jgi:tRNA-dihydrouridine synthase